MTTTISLEEAQSKLAELIASLGPEDEMIITQNEQAIAELRLKNEQPTKRKFGSCRGMLTLVTEDEEHLDL